MCNSSVPVTRGTWVPSLLYLKAMKFRRWQDCHYTSPSKVPLGHALMHSFGWVEVAPEVRGT